MKTTPVGTRLDADLLEAFLNECARRKSTKSDLLLTFIRDGLARYDSVSTQVLETQLAILEQMKAIGELAGASLHHGVEQTVINLPQGANESAEAYRERLQAEYEKLVLRAVGKGGRIHAVSTKRPPKVRVAS